MTRRLLNKEEAGEYLGISARQMRQLAYERRIDFVKVGGALRFDIRVLDRFIDEHTTEAAS